jgi:hypothetical protein
VIPTSWTFSAKLCLCAAVLIVLSQATDADLLDREVISMNTLRAATVDLNTLDTANNTQKSFFFNIQGLVPGGFQVNSVRIKNDGELDMMIAVSTKDTTGSSALCSALELKVLENWQSVYDNALGSFSYNTSIQAGEAEDLVFAVRLTSPDTTAAATTCAFNFVVETTQEAGGGTIRFKDEELLQNQVATGSWST